MDTAILLATLVAVAIIAVVMVFLVKGVKAVLDRPQVNTDEVVADLWQSDSFRRLLIDNIDSLFKSETKALAKAYAREYRTAQ